MANNNNILDFERKREREREREREMSIFLIEILNIFRRDISQSYTPATHLQTPRTLFLNTHLSSHSGKE
jgi:hypothetical protein